MNKDSTLEELDAFKRRLLDEVGSAYRDRGGDFGRERFKAWRRSLTVFLSENMPSQVSVLNERLDSGGASVIFLNTSAYESFLQQNGNAMAAYIDSLIIDVENGEYAEDGRGEIQMTSISPNDSVDRSKVFIVHGHDNEAKQSTARFVESLGFEAIVLHEQASGGRTIIEKIEKYSDVGFGIVLYTPDDEARVKAEGDDNDFRSRARQNVVFEHGFLIGKIGRNRVASLVAGDIELPGDIGGMVYISDDGWQVQIAKEMKAAGYEIDFNRII